MSTTTMAAPTFRAATPADIDRITEIRYLEPGQEAVGLAFGSPELARRLGYELLRMGGCERIVLALVDGETVGALESGADAAAMGDFVSLQGVAMALRVFGPLRFVTGLPRVRARARVDIAYPAGAYIVQELHVHPEHRNRGIGGALLSYAEELALRGRAPRMALTTHMENPARHLYERHGFRVAEERTDAAFERYTGIPGRYLMIKELP